MKIKNKSPVKKDVNFSVSVFVLYLSNPLYEFKSFLTNMIIKMIKEKRNPCIQYFESSRLKRINGIADNTSVITDAILDVLVKIFFEYSFVISIFTLFIVSANLYFKEERTTLYGFSSKSF